MYVNKNFKKKTGQAFELLMPETQKLLRSS